LTVGVNASSVNRWPSCEQLNPIPHRIIECGHGFGNDWQLKAGS
jgi:hypothetical protein